MIILQTFDKDIINSGFYTKKDSDLSVRQSGLIESFDDSCFHGNDEIAYCHQIHSDTVFEASKKGFQGNGDAVWTMKKGLKCVVKVADCVPILFSVDFGIYKIVGAIHSGWQGTVKNIVAKTFEEIKKAKMEGKGEKDKQDEKGGEEEKGENGNKKEQKYKKNKWYDKDERSFFQNVKVWIGPSICQNCYEFGKEAENLFEDKYIKKKQINHRNLKNLGKKNNSEILSDLSDFLVFVDIRGKVIDQLLDLGILLENIEIFDVCTFESESLCYSWRRNKDSGRMIAWIELKD